ncbi:MAG: shikimate kinase [Bacteroidales bacterium]|nr:shikimate kinase [Bacteroidales bacterium]
MRIYLIGYMASGKSNLGRLLAEKLDYRFLDLDFLFEERYRISILDFFEKYDEGIFRQIERSLLLETIKLENIIISTGGGTPCFFDNMEVIKKAGTSIYLLWEVPSLLHRLKMVKRKRPLLKDIIPDELEARVVAQLAQREPFYKQADFIVSGEDFDMESLLLLFQNRGTIV